MRAAYRDGWDGPEETFLTDENERDLNEFVEHGHLAFQLWAFGWSQWETGEGAADSVFITVCEEAKQAVSSYDPRDYPNYRNKLLTGRDRVCFVSHQDDQKEKIIALTNYVAEKAKIEHVPVASILLRYFETRLYRLVDRGK